MRLLKEATTVTVQVGPYLDASDGVTAETGLSPTIEISKAGAVFAARNSATAIAHDADGWYRVELDATDTATVGPLVLKGTETGALPVWHEFYVVEANVFDALFAAGAAAFDANADVTVGSIASGAITAAAIASNAITSAKIADGALTAAKFASGAFDAVWSVTTRLLTAGTNIVLAKGTGVTGFNDLSAAQVNAEVDAALDTAVPVTPTAGSINERIKTMDDADIPGVLGTPTGADLATDIAGVQADTDNVQTRLPAALVNSRMDATIDDTGMESGAVDAIWNEPLAEPAGVFNWSTTRATMRDLVQWMGALARNRVTQTATTQTLRNDADGADLATSTVSDDGVTATRGKWG